jgi:ATP-dependent DNA helicase RecQ
MELGALAQGEFRVVAIDEYGLQILKNSLSVTIRKERLEEKQRGVKGRRTAYGSEENHTVFEQLRGLRTEIAKRSNVPPYVVFSDKTLQEMAAKLPQNRSEMLQIGGIGEVKFDRYGEAFLELCLSLQAGTI